MTADKLNAHLASGGVVQIGTYTRSAVYTKPGSFRQGEDGNLYVRRGRKWDCLTYDRGRELMVSVRLGWYVTT